MKITLTQAVEGYDALQRVGSEKIPIKQAYLIQRNMRILQPDVNAYNEKRIELVKTKYGVKGKKDGEWTVPQDKIPAFLEQLISMGSTELDLDIHVIEIDTININISPNDLLVLDWMFSFSDKSGTPKIKPN